MTWVNVILSRPISFSKTLPPSTPEKKGGEALIHHQGIICGVAFAHSSLRRIAAYASVVAPRRLASDASLVIRNPRKPDSRFGCGNKAVDLGRIKVLLISEYLDLPGIRNSVSVFHKP
jgi:hypothetical protein